MKHEFFGCLFAISCLCAATAAAGPLRVGTTIDFLDYVFEDTKPDEAFYSLERYERRIAELAAGGIDRIYLRVNVCGLTLYPTGAGVIYGEQGGFHRLPAHRRGARNLIATLKEYDPLKETIRLGRKYGLEVWCWESLWDDAATWVTDEPAGELAQYGCYPLMDPYFRAHPEGYAMRDPRLIPSGEAVRAARSRTVAKLEIVSERPSPKPPRVKPENVMLYSSADNRAYIRYDGPQRVRVEVLPDRRSKLVVDQLALQGPYVKLVHREALPADGDFTFVVTQKSAGTNCRLFDAAGAIIPSSIGQQIMSNATAEASPLNFAGIGDFAWDYAGRQLGFLVGGDDSVEARYLLGYAEFAVPETRRHKLAKFEELARYGFDGYLFNLRSHSGVGNPDEYGYNPALRALYQQRYGKDIWRDEIDRKLLNELRAEAIDGFLADCKKMIGARPLYFSGVANDGKKSANGMTVASKRIGLPWHYAKWFETGTVDGIVMLGDDFVPELKAAAGARPVKIGIFYELLHNKGSFPDFIRQVAARPELDEVELYEAMVLSFDPSRFDLIKEAKRLRLQTLNP